jgi:hypothetical protein
MWLVDVVVESSCNIIFYPCLEAVKTPCIIYINFQSITIYSKFSHLAFNLCMVKKIP